MLFTQSFLETGANLLLCRKNPKYQSVSSNLQVNTYSDLHQHFSQTKSKSVAGLSDYGHRKHVREGGV